MTVKALLELIRPPNVFTAFADCLAGLLILGALGVALPDGAAILLLSSGCLYLSGIVLNDVFDQYVDLQERPTRPIPSGAISVELATAIGVGLMMIGLLIAASVGPGPLTIGVILACCIVLYDGGLKRSKAGPLVMGACRGLDLALGLSAGLSLDRPWPVLAIAGPVVLALYVAALTYIARDEVDGNTQRRARTGLSFMAALGGFVVVSLLVDPRWPASPWAWPWVIAALLLAYKNWSPLWRRHDGATTGRAIGGGIMLIPLIDAAVCAVAGAPLAAIAVVALVVPALILKQFFSPT